MKHWSVILWILLAGFLMAGAALTEDELEYLEDSARIVGVSDDTIDIEDEYGEDVEWVQLKFTINQRQKYKEDYKFRVRVTVELTDKKTKTIAHARFARERGGFGEEYTGVDVWRFLVPQGELKRPKVTAYAIQYGMLVDGEFVVLAEELDGVDAAEEIEERTPERLEQKPEMEYQYYFLDSENEEQTSAWQ
jgi:hypothetical protein